MTQSSDAWVPCKVAGRATLTRSRVPLAVWLSAALAMLGSFGCSQEKKLRFTAIPHSNTTELSAKFQPVAAALEKALGVPVEYVPVVDYAASVAAFATGDIQLAWFGGLTGVQARSKVPGSRAIAQGRTDPTFKSYFVVHKDTGIQPGPDFPMAMEGLEFTFGSESSTSGRLMPEYFIRKFTGRSPKEFFGQQPGFSGQHDTTALQVQNHTYDAGALNYVTYDSMVAEGKLDPTLCVKVWETPTYADYNWTAHPSLDTDFGSGSIDRLQQALIQMTDPALLAALERPEGLIAARNEDFEQVRETAVALDMLR